MDFEEYIELACVTVREDLKFWDRENHTQKELACMCALGLCGELVEYTKNPSIDEAGDILWYSAVLYKTLGLTQPKISPRYSAPFMATGVIAELVKKWAFHDKEPRLMEIKEWVDDVISYIDTVHELDTVMEVNVDKLQQRYPDGFTIS